MEVKHSRLRNQHNIPGPACASIGMVNTSTHVSCAAAASAALRTHCRPSVEFKSNGKEKILRSSLRTPIFTRNFYFLRENKLGLV
jgi:hypothetical protein